MRQFLNTLFVLNESAYLSLDGENVVVSCDKAEVGRVALHTLESILCFSYAGASPALMGKCGRLGIDLCFFSPQGRFLARTVGEERGNVLLRQTQYEVSASEARSCAYARNFILGKVYNARWVLERATRDHPQRVPVEQLKQTSAQLAAALPLLETCEDLEQLRGLEGEAAQRYFDRFHALILQQKEDFAFTSRSRRPPRDNVNALLSFAYSLLANDCAVALEGVGLDPYVGFLHRARPGRRSLALDLMEELRAVYADRFVLSCINQKVVNAKQFEKQENGAVLLTEDGRRAFLHAWQLKKREVITHPFLKEKLSWGLVPYVQALLLARTLRGDLDVYPPFFWKLGAVHAGSHHLRRQHRNACRPQAPAQGGEEMRQPRPAGAELGVRVPAERFAVRRFEGRADRADRPCTGQPAVLSAGQQLPEQGGACRPAPRFCAG